MLRGNLVDFWTRRIYAAIVHVEGGKIRSIEKKDDSIDPALPFILPGFIDSHIHIESSMLVPVEFARLAVVHGTVATVSDPHEIANVCGMEGVRFMVDNGKKVPFKFNFGAPSCVPATAFETAGAKLDAADVRQLLEMDEIKYLSEMMNFPGVLHQDPEVMAKISAAKELGKPVDGHAPGLRGEMARAYIEAGISTDHECFTAEEALDKLKCGMKIIIREGSAAKNFEALIGLMNDHPEMMMFCSDDKHPDSLVAGHIDQLCARAVARGVDLWKVIAAACINPVLHYNLNVGMLRVHDPADMILVHDLSSFKVLKTYINGECVAADGKTLIAPAASKGPNSFDCDPVTVDELAVKHRGELAIPVIEALDGQLITNRLEVKPKIESGLIVSDTVNDVLKIVVVNRYRRAPVAKAFIRNFNMKHGAIASSVAHDSHNIVAVGVDDESLSKAINLVIQAKGGVSCVIGKEENVIALPVGGLMSTEDGYKVAADYTAIDAMAKSAGCTLGAPFMTLSFMALLVIPHLKLSDLGLFDGDSFSFVSKVSESAR